MKKVISTALAMIMLVSMFAVSANAAKGPYGTVVEAKYSENAPDMSAALPDDSWGEKVAHITGETENAAVVSYHTNIGKVREDLSCDVYMKWNNENLYLCFVSPDDDIRGATSHHTGDGILMDMVFGGVDMSHFTSELAEDSVTWRGEYCYSVTFADDNKTVDYDGASLKLKTAPVIFYDAEAGLMAAKLEVPFTALGMSKKAEAKNGDVVSFSMCRIEGIAADGYLGWLEWGNYYDSTKETADSAANTASIGTIEIARTKTGNTIMLSGKGEPVEPTEPSELEQSTEPVTPVTPTEQPSSWAKAEVDAAITAGLVPTELQSGYTNGISREALSKILSALLDKVYGKAPEKNDAKFNDTTDADVLKAANLGIINGYDAAGGTKDFKPNNTLKRSEMTTIINRVAKLCGKETTGYESEVTFTDTASHWCNKELGWAVHNGIVKGTSAATFSPENTLTVEQTIMMIYRTFEAMK